MGERTVSADGAGLREWIPKHRRKGLDEGRDTSPTPDRSAEEAGTRIEAYRRQRRKLEPQFYYRLEARPIAGEMTWEGRGAGDWRRKRTEQQGRSLE